MDTIWATGTTVQTSLGTPGLIFLGVAVTMAILTGINGFFVASSRLVFGMARARVLPSWFASVHPTHRTPRNAILFTGLVSLIAPWLGREVILWIVAMSAVGTSVGYGYTCVAAFILARRMRGQKGALKQAVLSAVGVAMSLGFLVLLMVPGMPAFMERPSWIALGAWVALGTVFFVVKARQYRAIPKKELDYLIMGVGGAKERPVPALVED